VLVGHPRDSGIQLSLFDYPNGEYQFS